jgi:Tfp pilus assembly protein FimV
VGVQPLDAGLAQWLAQRLGQGRIEVGEARLAGRDLFEVDQVTAAPPPVDQPPEESVQGREIAAPGEEPGGRTRHARSSLTRAPEETVRKTVASPDTVPMMFTGLAARGRSSVLAGVRP